jgi:hypothetical protein
MASIQIRGYVPRWPTAILPALHVLLCALAGFLEMRRQDAWFRMIGIDPPCFVIIWWMTDQFRAFAFFLILGTAWWYAVGRLTWASNNRRFGGPGSTLTTLFALVVVWAGISGTVGAIQQEVADGTLSVWVVIQYALIALLCVGAILCVGLSTLAAVTSVWSMRAVHR